VTTAIILAGGMGTRLRSAVPDLPKPMAPINGRPFIEYQMDYWIEQGVGRFMLSVGYMKEVIMDHLGSSYRSASLTYAIEEEPLGTGGGLLLAAQDLSESFLVLNGDTFFEVDLATLRKFHANHSADWTFSLFRTSEGGRYMGIEVKSDGKIGSLQSGTGEQSRLANGGVYLVNPSVLANKAFAPGSKLSLEDALFPALVAEGYKLYGLEFPGVFIDIGIPQDYFRAAKVLTNRTGGTFSS
jgi:D-glycero-alpha-D-manno-heptose 1-phosphate guanylyltransferase